MSRTPSFGTLRDLSLASINSVITRIRERFEAIESRLPKSPASEAALSALEKQVQALQMGAKTTTVVQQRTPSATPAAAGFTEVATDPAAPVVGDAWVLRSLVNPAGTLQGFAGGFPLVLAADQNRFDLSIATSEGTKRVQIA